MRITFKKFLSFIFFLMIVQGAWNNPLFSMELLDNQNATWSTVLSGSTICPPALTSYGICLASDAKNLIAISSNGNILWEKSFSRSKNVTICSLPSDFILFFDNDKNLMKLINPSGSLVWEIQSPFKVTDTQKNVFSGRDGRFIIKNEAQIYCYGINGICRWSIDSLELKKLPAQELPDGSIIFFTKEKDSKTWYPSNQCRCNASSNSSRSSRTYRRFGCGFAKMNIKYFSETDRHSILYRDNQ